MAKIRLSFIHYPVCSGRYMVDAFKALGHEVRHSGPSTGSSIWGTTVDARYAYEPNDSAFDDGSFEADLEIIMDSDASMLDTANYYAQAINYKPPVVVYGVDNHVRGYYRPNFAHHFLAHRSVNIDPYWAKKPELFTWLPCGYDDKAFTPSLIPWEQREYDVCMVGIMYPNRYHLLNQLRRAGLKVFGRTGLLYQEYAEAYQNSRIALVPSLQGDLPIRLFEGAGMGCAVLSDYITDLKYLFDPPVAQYLKPEHAVDLAQRIIALPAQKAQDAADRAAQWAIQGHTWKHRAQTIIDWLEKR